MNIEKAVILKKEIFAEKLRRSYYEFLKFSFTILEPTTEFVDNWHIKYICDVVQAEVERIARGEPSTYEVIVINVPPRTLKSYMVARSLNAWAWIKYPHLRFIGTSYGEKLAISHALDTRRIIRSKEYQELFGDEFAVAFDQDAKTRFDTDKGGMRLIAGVGGSITGEGGDVIWTDDPLNPKQADSQVVRETVNEWWDKTFFSRLNNARVGIRLVIMQRLHENDLTGHILKKQNSDYKVLHICLPAELPKNILPDKYGNKTGEVSPVELRDRYVDGLLFPEKLSANELKKQKRSLNPYGFAAQMQQRPSPEGGGKFKREWFKIVPATTIPKGLKRYFYTDPAGGKSEGDEMASGSWSIFNGKIIIWEILSVRTPFNDFVGMYTRNEAGAYEAQKVGEYDNFVKRNGGQADSPHYMETNSTIGQGYVDYGNEWTPFRYIPDNVNGLGSKEVRAYAAITTIWSGRVHLVEGLWNEAFLQQVEAFPKGSEDGQVDVLASIVRKTDLTDYSELEKEYNKLFGKRIPAEEKTEEDIKTEKEDLEKAKKVTF